MSFRQDLRDLIGKQWQGCFVLTWIPLWILVVIFALIRGRQYPSMSRIAASFLLSVLACFLAFLTTRRMGPKREDLPRNESDISKLALFEFFIGFPLIVAGVCWAATYYLILGKRQVRSLKHWVGLRPATMMISAIAPQLAIAYYFVGSHYWRAGVYIALVLAYYCFVAPLEGLKRKGGVLKYFAEGGTTHTPTFVLACALLLALAFGCLHYALWITGPWRYTSMHGWQDAVYFSVTTMATVGYGDVTPTGPLARWTCVAEIVSGFTLLVLAVNASLTIWIQTHQPSPAGTSSVPTKEQPEARI